jgi:hypothetical protein
VDLEVGAVFGPLYRRQIPETAKSGRGSEPLSENECHVAGFTSPFGSQKEVAGTSQLRSLKRSFPKPAREDLVVAHVRHRPRRPAVLHEHKSPAHRDDLALSSGRAAAPRLLLRVYRAVPPQECRIRRLADPKQQVAHFHEFGHGGLCLLQPLTFLPPPPAPRRISPLVNLVVSLRSRPLHRQICQRLAQWRSIGRKA